MPEICPKLRTKTPKRRQWSCSSADFKHFSVLSIFDCEQVSAGCAVGVSLFPNVVE